MENSFDLKFFKYVKVLIKLQATVQNVKGWLWFHDGVVRDECFYVTMKT